MSIPKEFFVPLKTLPDSSLASDSSSNCQKEVPLFIHQSSANLKVSAADPNLLKNYPREILDPSNTSELMAHRELSNSFPSNDSLNNYQETELFYDAKSGNFKAAAMVDPAMNNWTVYDIPFETLNSLNISELENLPCPPIPSPSKFLENKNTGSKKEKKIISEIDLIVQSKLLDVTQSDFRNVELLFQLISDKQSSKKCEKRESTSKKTTTDDQNQLSESFEIPSTKDTVTSVTAPLVDLIVESNDKKKSVKCHRCSEVSHHARDFWSHITAYHPRTFFCLFCGENFQRYSYASRHIKERHIHTRPHVCQFCGQCFKRNSTLKRHERSIHLQERKWKCDICDQPFARRDNMMRHRNDFCKNKHSKDDADTEDSEESVAKDNSE